MIRAIVNSTADWFWSGVDEGDAFTKVGRFALFVAGILAAAFVFLVAISIPFILLVGSKPPSLFCASGTDLHSRPTTQIVGKVPVEGVEYTCG